MAPDCGSFTRPCGANSCASSITRCSGRVLAISPCARSVNSRVRPATLISDTSTMQEKSPATIRSARRSPASAASGTSAWGGTRSRGPSPPKIGRSNGLGVSPSACRRRPHHTPVGVDDAHAPAVGQQALDLALGGVGLARVGRAEDGEVAVQAGGGQGVQHQALCSGSGLTFGAQEERDAAGACTAGGAEDAGAAAGTASRAWSSTGEAWAAPPVMRPPRRAPAARRRAVPSSRP